MGWGCVRVCQCRMCVCVCVGLDAYPSRPRSRSTPPPQVLKERETILGRGGTTTESAEMSYRIRAMLRGVKECASTMQDLTTKEVRKVRGDVDLRPRTSSGIRC